MAIQNTLLPVFTTSKTSTSSSEYRCWEASGIDLSVTKSPMIIEDENVNTSMNIEGNIRQPNEMMRSPKGKLNNGIITSSKKQLNDTDKVSLFRMGSNSRLHSFKNAASVAQLNNLLDHPFQLESNKRQHYRSGSTLHVDYFEEEKN